MPGDAVQQDVTAGRLAELDRLLGAFRAQVGGGPTPGIRTSEFWGAAAYVALVALNNRLGLGVSDELLMTTGAVVVAYVGQRAWVKGRPAGGGMK